MKNEDRLVNELDAECDKIIAAIVEKASKDFPKILEDIFTNSNTPESIREWFRTWFEPVFIGIVKYASNETLMHNIEQAIKTLSEQKFKFSITKMPQA